MWGGAAARATPPSPNLALALALRRGHRSILAYGLLALTFHAVLDGTFQSEAIRILFLLFFLLSLTTSVCIAVIKKERFAVIILIAQFVSVGAGVYDILISNDIIIVEEKLISTDANFRVAFIADQFNDKIFNQMIKEQEDGF